MTARKGRRYGRTGGTCRSGKVRYRDRAAAADALAVLIRRDDPGHTESRAYSCPDCAGWHLTSRA